MENKENKVFNKKYIYFIMKLQNLIAKKTKKYALVK
jgi:hypothetical protein